MTDSTLLTPRDWQAQALREAAECLGTHAGVEALVAAKRYGALADEIDNLKAQLEDRAKDTARVNWLSKNILCADFCYGQESVPVLVFSWPEKVGVGGNLRMNVDAAIFAETSND